MQDDGATETIRKYYAFAGQTIAMRDGQDLKYFLTDHLGSVVAVTDAAGEVLEQQRYLPFGEVRADLGPLTQTDFGYTFQRNLDAQGGISLGLMDYKARFYSPALGRFTQPDTIVPNPGDTQAWNRYSYVLGNPLRYIDPSGHFCTDPLTFVVCYAAGVYTAIFIVGWVGENWSTLNSVPTPNTTPRRTQIPTITPSPTQTPVISSTPTQTPTATPRPTVDRDKFFSAVEEGFDRIFEPGILSDPSIIGLIPDKRTQDIARGVGSTIWLLKDVAKRSSQPNHPTHTPPLHTATTSPSRTPTSTPTPSYTPTLPYKSPTPIIPSYTPTYYSTPTMMVLH